MSSMCGHEAGRGQCGMTLIELLAGLAVGLLVIAAALGTFALSHGISSTIDDITQLQQQGSFALRVIGTQLRSAGSIEPAHDGETGLYAFERGAGAIIHGADGHGGGADSLSVFMPPTHALAEQLRDCLGNRLDPDATADATFAVNEAGELTCTSRRKSAPLIGGVADFQISYRLHVDGGLRIMNAAETDAGDLWPAVQAVEVCLDLQGSVEVPGAEMPYKDCAGEDRPRRRRTHLVFRNVFDLRTQGL